MEHSPLATRTLRYSDVAASYAAVQKTTAVLSVNEPVTSPLRAEALAQVRGRLDLLWMDSVVDDSARNAMTELAEAGATALTGNAVEVQEQ